MRESGYLPNGESNDSYGFYMWPGSLGFMYFSA